MIVKNMVFAGSINQKVDVKSLGESCPYASYNARFPSGVHIRFGGHPITLYTSGKFIMPGMLSFEEAENNYSKFKQCMAPYFDTDLFSEIYPANIVCQSNTGYELDMPRLWLTLTSMNFDIMYEPEVFPGLILSTDYGSFNIFKNGYFMILGCKSLEQAEAGEKYLLELLKKIN